MENIPRSKILNGPLDVGVADVLLYLVQNSPVPHAVSTGAYLQDMVVCFRHHAPRTAAPIPVSPPGGSGRKGTDSYLVTVDIISAGKKCGSVRYPLVLVGNLNGVLKRTSFYQAVEESDPPLLAAFFVRDDGGSVGEPFVTLEDFLGQVGIWLKVPWYTIVNKASVIEM